MKFLCDVHISYKISQHLKSLGFEVLHVNEILDKWHTRDKEICKYADLNDFVVVTKDSDFRDSYFINNTPKKLIKINLGNISNHHLMEILSENIDSIQRLNMKLSFLIEVEIDSITYIERK